MAKHSTTGFEEPPIAGKKKRYTPRMEAIHKIDSILFKLPPEVQMQVYLWYKVVFEPPLLNQGIPPS